VNDTTTAAPAVAPATVVDQRDAALEVALSQTHALVPSPGPDFSPKNLDEAMRLCDILADSELVPKDYQRKPGNCLVAIQWGAEIGLKPLQAMQNIAVINGRPALWGDAQLALVRNSPHCEYVTEMIDEATGTAYCRAKRRGEPEQTRSFSIEDQKTAGLFGKAGPHTQYPKRMRQLRARAFALRDVFTDVLKGIPQAEELLSILPPAGSPVAALPRNATGAQVAAAAAPAAIPAGERSVSLQALVKELEGLAFNKGTAALAEAWQKQLTKADRTALGADELKRLQRIAMECDETAAAARQAAEAEAAAGAPSDV
jgi:hypothetical protein